jgi:RNA polymerase sigma-70 factor (ECF subfamily)
LRAGQPLEEQTTDPVKTDHAADVCLMTLVAANDAAAARTLDVRLRGRSLRIARSLLRHEADANDASQIGLLEVFRAASSYRGDSSLEHWADRIVVRASLRSLAKRRAWFGALDDEALPDELANPETAGPEGLLEQLEYLSPPLRTALILKYGFEYSVEEIAELTETPVNTVKDRLLRGKRALRRVVRREEIAQPTLKGRVG